MNANVQITNEHVDQSCIKSREIFEHERDSAWRQDFGCARSRTNGWWSVAGTGLALLAERLDTGIAMVAARYAKVDVLVHDGNEQALTKGLAFMGELEHERLFIARLTWLTDSLLQKDVKKGKLSEEDVS